MDCLRKGMRPLPCSRAGEGDGGGLDGIMAALENGYAAVANDLAHLRRELIAIPSGRNERQLGWQGSIEGAGTISGARKGRSSAQVQSVPTVTATYSFILDA